MSVVTVCLSVSWLCHLELLSAGGRVLPVGVGETLELRLVDLRQELGVYGGQLNGLVSKGGVKIAYIHRIFLQIVN